MKRGRARIVLLLAIVVAAAAPLAAASEIKALQKQLSEAEIAVMLLLRSYPTELDMEKDGPLTLTARGDNSFRSRKTTRSSGER